MEENSLNNTTTSIDASPNPQLIPADTGSYPARVDFDFPQKQSRLLAFFSLSGFRILFLIPHLIALYFIQIIALLVGWLNMWVVLFTGKGSPGMTSFISGTLRWSTRMSSYFYGLNDKYPPFKLK